jgi:hypothetical protein
MEKIKKLSIFDFDGTLVDTPLPEFGKQEYKNKTGKEWPHTGWWSKPLSLDVEIFDMPTVPMVMTAYEKEKLKPETGMIMLTGRMSRLGELVKNILDDKALTFHEYHYNRGGTTDEAKIKTLDSLMEKYTNVTSVEMWDDRKSHFEIFNKWGEEKIKEGRLISFKLNEVPSNNPH